jgi:tRNA nucleotidyltransferase (CCA-adding enzyme)
MADSKQVAEAVGALDLGPLRERLRGTHSYLVGGAARAIVVGEAPAGDIDIAVDGDVAPVVAGLEDAGTLRTHDRFETATVLLADGRHVDLARTRTETYAKPGALPDVEPAPVAADLARRDFSVNAIAIPLDPPHHPIDPFGGAADLQAGVLRALHPESFRDDPTRVVRAARYCVRLGLRPDETTRAGIETADLGTVSVDRRDAELSRLADEETASAGFRLLAEWGVLPIPPSRLDLISAIETEAGAGWGREARRAAILAVAGGGASLDRGLELATLEPDRPSTAVAAAAKAGEDVLLVAAAAGGSWVERYRREWRDVRLEIDGDDLIAAGIAPGPPIGAGLATALRLKLDGQLEGGRDAELEVALSAARAI